MGDDSASSRQSGRESGHKPPESGDEVPHAQKGLSGEEEEEIKERKALRAAVVYEVIRVEGEGELARGVAALFWSGLAAGFSMGLSVVGQAMLADHLPEVTWKPLLEKLGYSIGFIVVIMGRQQLFTENTLTAVLPVITRRRLNWLLSMLRLWSVVLLANLLGCLIFAVTIAYTAVLPVGVEDEVRETASAMMSNPPVDMFVKGIAAGWLIAALVWMLPSAANTEFFVIGLMTYLIALGGFPHVIVGSIEAFYLWVSQAVTVSDVALDFLLPTLAGNIVGGTALFAVLSYAQVREEIHSD